MSSASERSTQPKAIHSAAKSAKPPSSRARRAAAARSAAPPARHRLGATPAELQRRARVLGQELGRHEPDVVARVVDVDVAERADRALDARLVRLVLGGVVVEAVGPRLALAVAMPSSSSGAIDIGTPSSGMGASS